MIERGEDVWVWDDRGPPLSRRDARASGTRTSATAGPRSPPRSRRSSRKIEAYSDVRRLLHRADARAGRAARGPRADARRGSSSPRAAATRSTSRPSSRAATGSSSASPSGRCCVSRTQGYHGTHGYGTAIGGIAANRAGFGPQVESEQVPHDSVEALEEAIARVGAERIAAFFVEPVIGAGGVYPPGPRYIEGVAALCARNDVLLVVDSVICGFGRLGTWFGIERWDVVPDMITFAKGVTSGYLPLGGVIVSDRVAEPFWTAPGGPVFRQGATYAGHATCAAAALANIEHPRARAADPARRAS